MEDKKKPLALIVITSAILIATLLIALYFLTRDDTASQEINNSTDNSPVSTKQEEREYVSGDPKVATPTELPNLQDQLDRDSQRRDILEKIDLALQQYTDENNRFPTLVTFNTSAPFSIEIENTITIDTTDSLNPGTTSDNKATKYHFQYLSDEDYELGVCLETDDEFFNSFGAKIAGISC